MTRNKSSVYLTSILLFMLILPIVSILYQWKFQKGILNMPLIGKWFVFWSVGMRLFIAGLRQVTKPEFTAKEIFRFSGTESLVVIKELGFANISIGLLGILSILRAEWSAPAAITGGLYFGLAGILHLLKRPESKNEVIAMVSDLYIFGILLLFLVVIL